MFFGNTIAMSQKSLDYLWKKQEVTSANIANVDTPGYKRKEVSFEETFRKKLLQAEQSKDADSVRRAINESSYMVYDTSSSARADGNNVSQDVEGVELARATLQYQYLIQSVNADITRYRSAIKG